MITVKEAYDLIISCTKLSPSNRVDLSTSVSQILRQEIFAEREQPPFHRVAMDGIAFNLKAHDSGFLRDITLKIENVQRAGQDIQTLKNPCAAIEVMTGAPLPIGCDCVVRYEEVIIIDGEVSFNEDATFKEMQNVHLRGSDFTNNSLLLSPGKKILSSDIGVIVSQGLNVVEVGLDPKVAIISTGDELVDPGKDILDHQIRRSNPYVLQTELALHGFSETTLFHLPDNPSSMDKVLEDILNTFDVIIMSGGVSKGKFDFVPESLAKLGAVKKFHKIQQRPGKPFWFGLAENNKSVFALPGNPVSSVVCLRRYVIPALRKSKGELDYEKEERVVLGSDIVFDKELTYFCEVSLKNSNGVLSAYPIDGNGSGDYFKLCKSDGFVELEATKSEFKKGDVVTFFRWGGN